MANPAFTLQNIQNHIVDVAYQKLAAACSDGELKNLSSPEGASRMVEGLPSKVRMGWHRNEANTINGIFLCVYNCQWVQAWKLINNSMSPILIMPSSTSILSSIMVHQRSVQTLFANCTGKKHNEPVQYQTKHLNDPKKLKAFFAKNQGMLPKNLRTKLFPQVPKSPVAPKKGWNFTHIAGAIALLLGVAFVARRHLAK